MYDKIFKMKIYHLMTVTNIETHFNDANLRHPIPVYVVDGCDKTSSFWHNILSMIPKIRVCNMKNFIRCTCALTQKHSISSVNDALTWHGSIVLSRLVFLMLMVVVVVVDGLPRSLLPFSSPLPSCPPLSSSSCADASNNNLYIPTPDRESIANPLTTLDPLSKPTVTDDGDIVYLFPELQTTSVSKSSQQSTSSSSSSSAFESANAMILKRAGLAPNSSARDIQRMLNYNGISTSGMYEKQDLMRLLEKALPPLTPQEQAALDQEADIDDPSLLTEREIPFSVATDFNKLLAGGLGVVNLGGALFLGNQLGQITAAGYTLPGIYGTIAAGYPLLLGYGILFNLIPLVRNFVVQRQNAQIQERNAKRKQWRLALAKSAGKLQTKLAAAKRMALQQKRLGSSSKDILYDTASTTVEDLGRQKEQSDMSAFDKLLNNDNDNGTTKETSTVASRSRKVDDSDDGGAFQ